MFHLQQLVVTVKAPVKTQVLMALILGQIQMHLRHMKFLYHGLPRADRTKRDYLNAMLYSVQSPPIVIGDTVVHGSSIADRRVNKEAVPGWVS